MHKQTGNNDNNSKCNELQQIRIHQNEANMAMQFNSIKLNFGGPFDVAFCVLCCVGVWALSFACTRDQVS